MALDKSVGTQSLAMDSKKEEYKGKKLRVAIVGCGGIAQTHMEAYKGIPEVEIVAGVALSIPYANTVPVSAPWSGFSGPSEAMTILLRTSRALTNELLPAPFGPIMALVLMTFR